MKKKVTCVSVAVREGELVAVVGSSGSGKSLLAHAILGILPYNANVSGTMKFQGELMDEKKISELRGKEIAFVPQSTLYLDRIRRSITTCMTSLVQRWSICLT